MITRLGFLLQEGPSEVFGMEYGGTTYWAVIVVIALVVIGLVVLNQIVNGTFILKE